MAKRRQLAAPSRAGTWLLLYNSREISAASYACRIAGVSGERQPFDCTCHTMPLRAPFAEIDGVTAGYACYGPIACTVWSYDLYWIAVDPAHQGRGLGRALVEESERLIRDAGGRRVYIETSGKPQYVPTRGFYERCGYRLDVELAEFYGPGDSKVVYVKALE